jgi:hypothetical protein
MKQLINYQLRQSSSTAESNPTQINPKNPTTPSNTEPATPTSTALPAAALLVVLGAAFPPAVDAVVPGELVLAATTPVEVAVVDWTLPPASVLLEVS